jgi:hypothetical protein
VYRFAVTHGHDFVVKLDFLPLGKNPKFGAFAEKISGCNGLNGQMWCISHNLVFGFVIELQKFWLDIVCCLALNDLLEMNGRRRKSPWLAACVSPIQGGYENQPRACRRSGF